jgi:metal-dependent amidase/aminoacylase/carboxypeptidase family protein
MQDYQISKSVRAEFAKEIRRVQAAIAIRANRQFECDCTDGIFKCEGGVVVNEREIAIHQSYVVDDYGVRGRNPATPEEQAVVDAIMSVAADVEAKGIGILADVEPCRVGDPLRFLIMPW